MNILPLTVYSYVLNGICSLIIVEFNVVFLSLTVTSIKNRCGPPPPSNPGENCILNDDELISDTRISCGVSGLP